MSFRENLFRSFENGVAASQARVPALDTLMSSCPDLHTLKVTFLATLVALHLTPVSERVSE